MRENCTHGSEGGEGRWSFSTPIRGKDKPFAFVGACLQAIRAGQLASLHAKNRRQASSYSGKDKPFVFVGACLQAICAGQLASLHANNRWQASS